MWKNDEDVEDVADDTADVAAVEPEFESVTAWDCPLRAGFHGWRPGKRKPLSDLVNLQCVRVLGRGTLFPEPVVDVMATDCEATAAHSRTPRPDEGPAAI